MRWLSVCLLLLLITGPLGAAPLDLSRALVMALPASTEAVVPPRLGSLRVGSKGAQVVLLSAWLRQVSPISFAPVKEDQFGKAHEASVKALQRHLGLHPDGIAGPMLYTNFEVNAARKNHAVEQFAYRLEEIAHEARSAGHRKMVVVNVPSFTLRAINLETGATVIESPVVVGRKDRPTPLGRIHIISLKFNPTWTPPPLVLKRDILPRLARGDRSWFEKHPLDAVSPSGEIRPAEEISIEDYRVGWTFVQRPGQDNALGLIKFETDSTENIYLHDTNDRRLFGIANRPQSSGCIRVDQWATLAAFLADTSEEDIRDKIAKRGTAWQKVRRTPVYIEYSQGDVFQGRAVYFPDIYGRNPAQQ